MKSIILSSKSPRRQQLLAGLDIPYSIDPLDIDESFPTHLIKGAVAEYLCNAKSEGYSKPIGDQILLTCDTIVCIDNLVINKPANANEAKIMLQNLSGKMHEVYTGVCLRNDVKKYIFSECTKVYFRELSESEIEYYIEKYKPYDKAGAYGVQEWLGYVAVEKIEGCFYNVMGLPLSKVYEALKQFEN
jgi:septum formation protein